MIFCDQCGHWHGNSKRAHTTNCDELATTRLRSFAAMLATYPETMKNKHVRVAMRAYCMAHGLDQVKAREVTRDITAI